MTVAVAPKPLTSAFSRRCAAARLDRQGRGRTRAEPAEQEPIRVIRKRASSTRGAQAPSPATEKLKEHEHGSHQHIGYRQLLGFGRRARMKARRRSTSLPSSNCGDRCWPACSGKTSSMRTVLPLPPASRTGRQGGSREGGCSGCGGAHADEAASRAAAAGSRDGASGHASSPGGGDAGQCDPAC